MFITGIRRVIRRSGRRLQSHLDDWLVDLSVNTNSRLNRILLHFTTTLRLLIVFLLDGWHGEAQIWHGCAIGSNLTLRVAYLADRRSYRVLSPEYLQEILFEAGTVQIFPYRKFTMLRVHTHARKLAAETDMVIVEANKLLRFRPPRGAHSTWRIIAPWVRMVIDFTPGQSWSEVDQAMHAQRKNLKAALHADPNFSEAFQISHAEEDFDLFYDRMHVPLMAERYGGAAQVDSKEGLRAKFHQGLLMLLYHDGQPVAGALNHLQGRTLLGVGLGVLDGDKRWYSLGAMTLLYYHSIRWSFENGIRRLDFGGVRPFLKDSLYDYKRRWGFQPYHDPWMERDWLFWVPSASPAALTWLDEHPFLMPIDSSDPSS